MGVVYAAHHPANGQRVALKLIGDALVGQALLLRFKREGRALAALQHPNIVRVHSSGEHRGRPYLALEFVDGVALDAALKREGPWEPRRAATLVATLARALAHAHAQGILHRDLKPANVLLDAAGQPRLTDFGLAREPGADREHLTRTGEVLGTPSFMSPEQANGQAQVDPRADVYGLGAVLFALLTGRPPFRGSSLVVLKAVLEDPPPRPSSLRPGIPRQLEEVCLRCLAKDPGKRFPDADGLARELERFVAGQGARRRRALPLALTGCLLLAGAVVAAERVAGGGAEDPSPLTSEVEALPAAPVEVSNAQTFAQSRTASRELCALSLDDDLEAVLARGAELEEADLLTGLGYLHLARASAKHGEQELACARYAEAGARCADIPDSQLADLDRERREALTAYARALYKAERSRAEVLPLTAAWVEAERRPEARRHALWISSVFNRQEGRFERAIEHARAVRSEYPELLDGYDLLGHALVERWKRSPTDRDDVSLEEAVRELDRAIELGRKEKHRLWQRWVLYRGEAKLLLFKATRNASWLEGALADGELAAKYPRRTRLSRVTLLRARALRKLKRYAEARELLVTTIPKVKGDAETALRLELTAVVQEDF